MQTCGRPRPATHAASLRPGAVQSRSARRAVEPLGEFHDQAFWSADVAEEEGVLEVDDPASRTRSTTPRTSSTLKATCRSPGRFAAGAASPAPAEGDWKRTTSNMSLPS